MKRLDAILPAAIQRRTVIAAARAQKALAKWDQVVGQTLAEKSWPDRFENGTAFVAVSSSAWAQELRMRKETILERLRALTNDEPLVKNLRFGVRPLPKRNADRNTENLKT